MGCLISTASHIQGNVTGPKSQQCGSPSFPLSFQTSLLGPGYLNLRTGGRRPPVVCSPASLVIRLVPSGSWCLLSPTWLKPEERTTEGSDNHPYPLHRLIRVQSLRRNFSWSHDLLIISSPSASHSSREYGICSFITWIVEGLYFCQDRRESSYR